MNDAGVRLCITNANGALELSRLSLPTLTMLVIVGDGQNLSLSGTTAHIAYAAFIAGDDNVSPLSVTLPVAGAPAIIAYTSGTTGRAKGALLMHCNLVANIVAVITAWHWTARDRLLLTLPLFHAHGLMVGMHGTLFSGGSVVLRAKFDASDVLATFRDDPSISLFFGVPTMYTRLLAEVARQKVPAHQLRLFVSGSAPLSAQVPVFLVRVLIHTLCFGIRQNQQIKSDMEEASGALKLFLGQRWHLFSIFTLRRHQPGRFEHR